MASAPAIASAPAANPQAFGKRGVLALVVFGTLAFVALLYLIGAGQMTGPANNGQAHAGSKGLTGYAALVQLLEGEGHDVTVSRSEAQLDDEGLLVLTPPPFTDVEELRDLINRRRYVGPTLVILPKWQTTQASDSDNAKSGWVRLFGAFGLQESLQVHVATLTFEVTVSEDETPTLPRWSGPGSRQGRLPTAEAVQTFSDDSSSLVIPLVTAPQGVLAGYYDDNGYYDALAEAGGVQPNDADTTDMELWNVTIIAEPDLVNNWGLADRSRSELAHLIVDLASEGDDQQVVFDTTLNGLGGSRNLLTLAFEPPFLAATLCLIMALLLVGWRAFKRFGPAAENGPNIAFGKGQLVENGASVIQRTRRVHLLTRPYAALMAARIARSLGLRGHDRATIDDALVRRGLETVSPRLATLENARHRADIIRAARALHSLERTLTR
ncbi:DUF4350 domain-containing protein [Parerythrobacter jejuensis]|uniref:DUF4350 domain-containing protein n=1 Tax=Parerythrobacter jejuensis TaxID=795812 RepID=A0A845ALU1_9SPHN|nr:DUF4350 domain-containing protein [Parerythrobacter jejuensis]MXP30439.1 DUF4350 domain-containing protein [Parerythrobacter jejuensis]MXP33199.1 DUF4350 domain-containing protein [Parerythrobacter jejuensis]